MQKAYSKSTIYRIAKDNYNVLKHYCSILEEDGYWKAPGEVLHKSVFEILDLYVQAILIHMMLQYNCINEDAREFIIELTDENDLCIFEGAEITEKMRQEAMKLFSSPPILLQLCGLRDTEKNCSLTGLFFDAVLNIIIAFSYVTKLQDAFMMQYIQAYFRKVQAFLHFQKNSMSSVDEKYIFRKLCNGEWENSKTRLLEAGENFAEYKRKSFYYVDHSVEHVTGLLETGEQEEHDSEDDTFSGTVYEERKKINYSESEHIEDNKEDNKEDNHNKDKDEQTLLEDIREEQKKLRLNELLNELNSLIGLADVKNEIMSLINLIKVKKLRERYHLPNMEMSFHMVFTGNPGTGKTTVARLVAAIYKELGVLSEGNLVETDRSGLVAGYVGQTAIKVKEVVEKAIGGVLFIDEAYSLAGNAGMNDFGSEAIDTLVKLMEDHRDDLVVIVAGYTKEMEHFLKSNTGLISRFNRFIHFPDYSEDELVSILEEMARKSGFVLEKDAVFPVRSHIQNMEAEEADSFGNARGIRNMFESLVVNQANRIVLCDNPDIEMLTHITREDVEAFLGTVKQGGVIA